ncbi:MAG: HEAT repeat domain-containing protein [Phycisphaerales bacterium]|nr:HEAT repeat domain-containing protein [Phycisphaerales bacterium]
MIEQEASAPDALLRANAVEAAGSSPVRLRGVIDRGLDDPNLGVRSVAAATAGRVKLKGAASRLHGLETDSSPYVRASAIGALARLGEAVDQSPLAEMLLGDPSPKIRSHAAFTLGEIGNRSALGLLKEAAGAKLERASTGEVKLMQLQIAEAMVKLGDEAQLQPIRAALYPSRPDELESAVLAVQILGQVRDKAAMGQLMHMASYRDQGGQPLPAEIRLAVCSALAKMGEKKGGFIADEFRASKSAALRAQAAAAYGDIGDGMSLARLKELLDDPDKLVRVAAAGGVLRAVGRE